MKKIMFMMMPLFLTALIFGAGCDQDSSATKDNEYATEADDYVKPGDPEYNSDEGLLAYKLAARWETLDVIQFLPVASTVLLNGKPDPVTDVRKSLVPAGKTLWLTGNSTVTLYPDDVVIVEGDLVLQAGTVLDVSGGRGASGDDYILLRGAGRLIVDRTSTLKYGSNSSLTSIVKGEVSALKAGGIEFRKGGVLDLRDAQTSGAIIIVASTSDDSLKNEISLHDVYNNSLTGDVLIRQGAKLSNDDVINFGVTADRTLYVDGGLVPASTFSASEIRIKKGLSYENIRSFLEHKPVIVEGELIPGQHVYPKTLTIAAGAKYSNSDKTTIDDALTLNGTAVFSSLTFTTATDVPVVTVGRTGSLSIGDSHDFYYSPEVAGTLSLIVGGTVRNGASLNISGDLYLGAAGSLALSNGVLASNTGRIILSATNTTSYGRTVSLEGDSKLTVNGSLDLRDSTSLSAGSLALATGEPALVLSDIILNGAFDVNGTGTTGAQIAPRSVVTFTNSAGTYGGVLNNLTGVNGTIDFKNEFSNNADEVGTRSFIFTGQSLVTQGSLSTLSLTDGQSIVFGKNAPARGIHLTDGSYKVESAIGGTRFAVGYLTGGSLGIGIGVNGSDAANGTTSLILGGNSTIRFSSDPDIEQSYLLTGSIPAVRGPVDTTPDAEGLGDDGYALGDEPGLFALKGTTGASPKIELANVLVVGQLGHATKDLTRDAYPLFSNAVGSAATGSLSVNPIVTGGGSLTVDHNYEWTYNNNGWTVLPRITW
jgi:hypothetical protein